MLRGPRCLPVAIALARPLSGSWVQLAVEDLEWLHRADMTFAGLLGLASCLPVRLQFVHDDGVRWSLRLKCQFRGQLSVERPKLFATTSAPIAEFVASRSAALAAAGDDGDRCDSDDDLSLEVLSLKCTLGCPECGRRFASAKLL